MYHLGMRAVGIAIIGSTIVACGSFGTTSPETPSPPEDSGSTIDASTAVDASPSSIPGLVAHWPLDESAGTQALDLGPTKSNGTLVGAQDWRPGRIGNAFRFNGTTHFNVPYRGELAPSDAFTFAAWLNPEATTYNQRLYARGFAWHVKLEGSNRRPALGSGALLAVTLGEGVPLGTWTHVAITFNRGAIQFFVNGVFAPSESHFPANTPMKDPLTGDTKLGASGNEADKALGLIDDVRLYDRVLTADEVASLAK